MTPLLRKVVAEFLGTAFLLVAVVGSGIAAQTLSPADTGLALLENAIATGAALAALILALGPVSGAHLNPVVSCADALFGGLRPRELATYIAAQVSGAGAGVMVANAMFGLPPITLSTHARSSGGQSLGEVVATAGLLLVIFGVVRGGRPTAAPFAVGAYITGAYFFTSSTSFANPAVTVARTLTDTFAGIAPTSAPPFLLAQVAGMAVACGLVALLWPRVGVVADAVVLPHTAAPDDRASPAGYP